MPVTVTLAQIAKFAQVQRPSVSNWRRRHVDFPAAVGGTNTQPLFDAEAVAGWLDQRSGRSQLGDGPTYGDLFRAGLRSSGPDGADLDGDAFADLALCLLALRAASGGPLPADGDELAAAAAEARSSAPALVALIDADAVKKHATPRLVDDINRLVDQLGVAAACEQTLDSARARGWSGAAAETASEVCDLIAQLADGLFGDLSGATLADLAAGPGLLLTHLCAGAAPKEIRYSEADPAHERWLRLRLYCHGQPHLSPHADGHAPGAFTGTDVVVVDPPFQSGEHEHRTDHPMSWAAMVSDSLSADGVGFAVVPEWTLTRSAVSRRLPVVRTREQLLRRGCLLAIIQLPRHLPRFGQGTDLALLVLGPDIGETTRDVLICDAAAIRTEVGDGWVSQTAAQICGSRQDRDPSVCRSMPVANLIGRRSLLPSHLLTAERAPDDHLTATIRARESAIRTFCAGSDATTTVQRVTVAERTAQATYRSLGELLRAGRLIRLPGHRIPTTALSKTGQRVYGPEELLGQVPVGQRRIDPAALGRYEAATITEPGDVIILAGEKLTALVDDAGGSVVITPVQGLRIPGYVKHSSLFRDEPQQAWIGPYALAALFGAERNTSRSGPRIRAVNLQQLDIPMLTAGEYDQLDQAARLLTDLAEQARAEAAALDRLRHTLATGVADAGLHIRLTPTTTTPNA